VLFANAALPVVGRLTDFDVDDLDRNLAVNLRAPIVMARIAVPSMLELRGFSNGLRQDLHGSGVGVSMVMPGFVSDAGRFVESGMELPPGMRTTTPERVAARVVRAIRHDVGEIVAAQRRPPRDTGRCAGRRAWTSRKPRHTSNTCLIIG
jgi:short-subunit dehydrogenase